jgi:hypothetical protein
VKRWPMSLLEECNEVSSVIASVGRSRPFEASGPHLPALDKGLLLGAPLVELRSSLN